VRLQEVWQDIELPQSQQVAVLEDVIARAHHVWEEAVAAAEGSQTRMRGEVEACLREVATIKEDLGDDVMEGAGGGGKGAGTDALAAVHKTLAAWRTDVLERVEHWRGCRLQRLAEHDELHALLRQTRSQIGAAAPAVPGKPDISSAALEYGRLELQKLKAEKVRWCCCCLVVGRWVVCAYIELCLPSFSLQR